MTESTPATPIIEQAKALGPFLGFGGFVATLPFLPAQLSYTGGLLLHRGATEAALIAACLAVLCGAALGIGSLRPPRPFSRHVIARLASCAGYVIAVTTLAIASSYEGVVATGASWVAAVVLAPTALHLAAQWLSLFMRLPLLSIARCLCAAAIVSSLAAFLASVHLIPYASPIVIGLALIGVLGPGAAALSQWHPTEQATRRTSADGGVRTASPDLLSHSMLPTVTALCFGLFLEIFAMSARLAAYREGIMPAIYQLYETVAPFAGALILLAFVKVRRH